MFYILGELLFYLPLGMVTAIIVLAAELKSKNNEIKKLKNNKSPNYCPNCGYQLNKSEKI